MQPDSLTLMIILAVVAACAPIAAGAFWVLGSPRSHRRWLGFPIIALILISQLAAVGAIGVRVNREFNFFATWDEVAAGGGGEAGSGPPAPDMPKFQDDGVAAAPGATAEPSETETETAGAKTLLSSDVAPGAVGTSKWFTYKGPRSGLRGSLHVWTPPQYDDPRYKDHVFPVVVAYPGVGADDAVYWGGRGLNAEATMNAGVASGKVAPFILVMPSVRFPHQGYFDPECLDAPGGAKAYTWAAEDVPTWIKQNYRVSSRPRDWNAFGFSVGGYCATKIHLQRPDVFGSAILFSGNVHASSEPGAGRADAAVDRLLRSDPEARGELLPITEKADPAKVRILLAETEDPQDGSKDLKVLTDYKDQAAAAGVKNIQLWNMGRLGHALGVWGANARKFLEWITTLMRA